MHLIINKRTTEGRELPGWAKERLRGYEQTENAYLIPLERKPFKSIMHLVKA